MVLEAMRRRQISLESLWPELQAERRHPWRQVGFDALQSAGMGLESVLEVRWADLEKAHGLPIGRRQAKVTQFGQVQFQDVSYDDYGLVVELDGRIGHEDTRGRLRDMRRDNRNVLTGRATCGSATSTWLRTVALPSSKSLLCCHGQDGRAQSNGAPDA